MKGVILLPANAQHDAWTWAEYDTIRKHYPKEGKKVVRMLNNRSVSALESRAIKINTFEHVEFTEEEVKLAKKYGKCMGKALMFMLPDRTPYEIEDLLHCVK